MPVFVTMDDIKRMREMLLRRDSALLPALPRPPDNLRAVGLKLGFRIEWSRVPGVDGYRVAVLSANNLASPERMSPLLDGDQTLAWDYFVGDVAITRQFTVQSYKRSVTGELLFSDFRRPFAEATSKAANGVADSAPQQPLSPSTEPSERDTPGDPGNVPTFL